ncbi:MAG: hypothetical protein ACJ74Y_12980, partial [Bryobacteraceae bacterium]
MRILYDGYIFAAQRNGGISKYAANIMRQLPERWTPILRSGNEPARITKPHPRLERENLPFNGWDRPRAFGHALRSGYFELLNRTRTYDVLHPTYHFVLPHNLVRKGRPALVMTIFDMIPEIYGDVLDRDGRQ